MSALNKLQSTLEEVKDILTKSSELKKDELDEKIKAKMQAEMERRGTTGKDIADHYRDIDESIPAKQRSNIKSGIKAQEKRSQMKVVKEEHCVPEVLKVDANGQWSLEKGALQLETVEEFKERGGKVDRVPPSNKNKPKDFDARPTSSVRGIYNTGKKGYAKDKSGTVPIPVKKNEEEHGIFNL